MPNKIKNLSNKQQIITVVMLILAISFIVTICWVYNRPVSKQLSSDEKIKDIKVTAEEMQEYRERIGTDMDIKKAYLILFDSEESCREFIEEHGADEDPTAEGIGIIPLMENGYYNIVGKKSLEDAFELLDDGDYSKEPIIYSNMYCYLKRIGVESLLNDDKLLKEFIQNEKYQELRKAGD